MNNVFSRAFSRVFSSKAASSSAVSFDTMNHAMIARAFGGPTAAGKSVTESSAMGISAAWSCQRLIAETVGMLPWGVYVKDDSGNAKQTTDHPLAEVLTQSPNADMTNIEFREAKVLNLAQAGNAYSMIDRGSNGRLISLTPIESRLVQPMLDATKRVYFRVNIGGVWQSMPREKIWHVKGFGSNGLVGLSPIGAAREALGLAMATEEFGARFFAQGGKPSGTVTIPNFLTKEQREIARENLQQMLGGISNAHKFALFEGGMKPEPWGAMPLEDMEFLVVRKFSVQEICRFFRVPPHMVADFEKGASYASIEQLSQDFVQFTLMPYFTRIEASASKWLLNASERGKIFLRFNYEGLLRADSVARSQLYASGLQNGWINRNEVRAKENLNRVEGLDEYTVQSNMIGIDDLGKNLMQSSSPAKPADAPEPAPASKDHSFSHSFVFPGTIDKS